MIAKKTEKEIALKLRLEGKTYSEILKLVKVSKSSLSLWLQSVGLAQPQKQRITEKRIAARLKALDRVRQIRSERTEVVTKKALSEIPALINDPFWVAGLMLYWAEGSKAKPWALSVGVEFSNMNAEMLQLFSAWCQKYLGTVKSEFSYEISIHENADSGIARDYWSNVLSVKPEEFRVYLKRHNLSPTRKNIGERYFGVIRIRINKSTDLNRRIAAWTQGVVKYLGHSRVV
ncbi:MAG TPA: hypothetical protein VLE93_03275 [Candidatus Saccharimonadales bacterium]|nr:hypothetical protein [Candidatus Saccharimonadales bacterium]